MSWPCGSWLVQISISSSPLLQETVFSSPCIPKSPYHLRFITLSGYSFRDIFASIFEHFSTYFSSRITMASASQSPTMIADERECCAECPQDTVIQAKNPAFGDGCVKKTERALVIRPKTSAQRSQESRTKPETLSAILNNTTGEVFANIMSYLNRTEYINLLLSCRTIKGNLEVSRSQIRLFNWCEAQRTYPRLASGLLLWRDRYCVIRAEDENTVLRVCEGPSRFNTGRHCSTLEICGACSNEALEVFKPRRDAIATPLCRTCSIAGWAEHKPQSFMCTCFSPFSSPVMTARLCYECRNEIGWQRHFRKFQLLKTKLPVLDSTKPETDEARWRQQSLTALGFTKVGCRSCGCGWDKLQKSYLDDRYESGSEYDLESDEASDGMRERMNDRVLFLCLECDRHVSQYNATINIHGNWSVY